jgi:hypothetical protein
VVERLVYTERLTNMLMFAHVLSPAFSEVKRSGGVCLKCSQMSPKNIVGGQKSGHTANAVRSNRLLKIPRPNVLWPTQSIAEDRR